MTIHCADSSRENRTHHVAAAEFCMLSQHVADFNARAHAVTTTSPAWSALWNVCADMWQRLEQAKAENALHYKPGEIVSSDLGPVGSFTQTFSELAVCLLRKQGERSTDLADFVLFPSPNNLTPNITSQLRDMILEQLDTPSGQALHQATPADTEIFSSFRACWRKAEEVDRAYKSRPSAGYVESVRVTAELVLALEQFDLLAQRITNESTRLRA